MKDKCGKGKTSWKGLRRNTGEKLKVKSDKLNSTSGSTGNLMDIFEKAQACARFADEKKAKDMVVLELVGLTDIADYFVLATGTSERHVRTIADAVEVGMKEIGVKPFSLEGYDEGRWIIIDYQNVIVHIFIESLRELYDLESLWIEAKRYILQKGNTFLGVDNG
ncbi:MAG: ribosome silencing factor [Syntrophorhabdus sp.]